MFGFRRQSSESLIGQSFQSISPFAGREMPVWQVHGIFAVGGVEHARLVGRDRPTEIRSVAVSVLTDPRRYRRVG
ncbi:MAG TPA: hypothetical protein VF342_14065 [Alphaproteobacteria bacterium]